VPNPNLVRSPSEKTAKVEVVPAVAIDKQEKISVIHFRDVSFAQTRQVLHDGIVL
jgi:hypothetical protein